MSIVSSGFFLLWIIWPLMITENRSEHSLLLFLLRIGNYASYLKLFVPSHSSENCESDCNHVTACQQMYCGYFVCNNINRTIFSLCPFKSPFVSEVSQHISLHANAEIGQTLVRPHSSTTAPNSTNTVKYLPRTTTTITPPTTTTKKPGFLNSLRNIFSPGEWFGLDILVTFDWSEWNSKKKIQLFDD